MVKNLHLYLFYLYVLENRVLDMVTPQNDLQNKTYPASSELHGL